MLQARELMSVITVLRMQCKAIMRNKENISGTSLMETKKRRTKEDSVSVLNGLVFHRVLLTHPRTYVKNRCHTE